MSLIVVIRDIYFTSPVRVVLKANYGLFCYLRMTAGAAITADSPLAFVFTHIITHKFRVNKTPTYIV